MPNWKLKAFNELTPYELYAILRLRGEVFIVEQNCPYLDEDDKDQKGFHLMGWQDDLLAAYTRLLPTGVSYPDMPSIGRVVTSPKARGKGIGRELMLVSIDKLYDLFGKKPIKIGAQLYLKKFYESLGFVQSDEGYLDDGIPHIHMIK
ncbi:MAG: GNAT family N-acetyltransferase [Chitinophagaceae bacterium]